MGGRYLPFDRGSRSSAPRTTSTMVPSMSRRMDTRPPRRTDNAWLSPPTTGRLSVRSSAPRPKRSSSTMDVLPVPRAPITTLSPGSKVTSSPSRNPSSTCSRRRITGLSLPDARRPPRAVGADRASSVFEKALMLLPSRCVDYDPSQHPIVAIFRLVDIRSNHLGKGSTPSSAFETGFDGSADALGPEPSLGFGRRL